MAALSPTLPKYDCEYSLGSELPLSYLGRVSGGWVERVGSPSKNIIQLIEKTLLLRLDRRSETFRQLLEQLPLFLAQL